MKTRTLVKILFVTAVMSMQIVSPQLHTIGQSGDAGLTQAGSYVITPVVRPRDRSPDGGRFFSQQNAFMSGSHSLNAIGDVAVSSSINAPCSFGVYLVSAAAKTTLADYCSETALGHFYIIEGANINDQGQAAVGGSTQKDFSGPVVSSIFASSAGALTKIAAVGDMPPPGTTFSGPFSYIGDREPFGPAINNQGDIAFYAGGKDASGSSVGGIFVRSS